MGTEKTGKTLRDLREESIVYVAAELFLQNSDALTQELDLLIKNITEMCDAIKANDRETLETILGRGRMVKEELGE